MLPQLTLRLTVTGLARIAEIRLSAVVNACLTVAALASEVMLVSQAVLNVKAMLGAAEAARRAAPIIARVVASFTTGLRAFAHEVVTRKWPQVKGCLQLINR